MFSLISCFINFSFVAAPLLLRHSTLTIATINSKKAFVLAFFAIYEPFIWKMVQVYFFLILSLNCFKTIFN